MAGLLGRSLTRNCLPVSKPRWLISLLAHLVFIEIRQAIVTFQQNRTRPLKWLCLQANFSESLTDHQSARLDTVAHL